MRFHFSKKGNICLKKKSCRGFHLKKNSCTSSERKQKFVQADFSNGPSLNRRSRNKICPSENLSARVQPAQQALSVRFRSKERGTRVKDCAKNGVSERAGKGWALPLPPLSFFGSCFIPRAAKTENPVPRSFFGPKPNGNACYTGQNACKQKDKVAKK